MTRHDWNGAGFCNLCHVFQANANLHNVACVTAAPIVTGRGAGNSDNGHDFDAVGICRLCAGSAIFVGGISCQSAPKDPPAPEPLQKQIHQMSLDDYRRGVAKVWPKVER